MSANRVICNRWKYCSDSVLDPYSFCKIFHCFASLSSDAPCGINHQSVECNVCSLVPLQPLFTYTSFFLLKVPDDTFSHDSVGVNILCFIHISLTLPLVLLHLLGQDSLDWHFFSLMTVKGNCGKMKWICNSKCVDNYDKLRTVKVDLLQEILFWNNDAKI